LAQETELNYEIIVVDNNSSDHTFSLVEQFSKEKVIFLREKNAGKVNALKKGVSYSSGELIIICDDDNYLNKNYLDVAYDFFKKTQIVELRVGRIWESLSLIFQLGSKNMEFSTPTELY
jgi:glycosyltransferase involved in cell wall biosynthesis